MSQDHFRMENTEGYSQAELDAFNVELGIRLQDYEAFTPDWYEAITMFETLVASR